MSKVDSLKALREARYAALQAQASAQRPVAAVHEATSERPLSEAALASTTSVATEAVAATTTTPAATAKPTAGRRAPRAEQAAVDTASAATAGVESTDLCGQPQHGKQELCPTGRAHREEPPLQVADRRGRLYPVSRRPLPRGAAAGRSAGSPFGLAGGRLIPGPAYRHGRLTSRPRSSRRTSGPRCAGTAHSCSGCSCW